MISAIIDLGTNTFHLLIIDKERIIFRRSLAPKLGEKGINHNIITNEALTRGIDALKIFCQDLENYHVQKDRVFAFATSAIRVAKNQHEVLDKIFSTTGIKVQVLDGMQEASFIYSGVKKAVNIVETSVIVDIGGGSVEFILCNSEKVLWMQSFEIGGQRLAELFMKKDPFPYLEIPKIEDFLRNKLLDLSNAIHQYKPKVLIGSSGSFDTLNDMYYLKNFNKVAPSETVSFNYPIAEFGRAFDQLVFSTRQERLQIPGMAEIRVDTIVMAAVLIKYLLTTFELKNIKISNYSLREGAIAYAQ